MMPSLASQEHDPQRIFESQLTVQRQQTLAALLSVVPDREPREYLYAPLSSHLSRAGKSIRPALCLASCRAFGGHEPLAEPSATAIEMLHNAFLVHDDIEDGSELRRGHPTMHVECGIPLAVNAGDMLNALSVRMLRSNVERLGPKLAGRIFDEFDHMMQESLEGQAMELGWVRDNRTDLDDDDYLRMVLKKTCWYSFIHPCRIGALIATRGAVDADRFNRFGLFLGAAFQIQDDLLNLVGDQDRYGKERCGDLFEGKRTLMLLHVMRASNARDCDRLGTFLRQPRVDRTAAEAEWLLEQMRRHGSFEYARTAARRLASAAHEEFARAFDGVPESPDRSFIHSLVGYMVDRDR